MLNVGLLLNLNELFQTEPKLSSVLVAQFLLKLEQS